MRILIAEDEQSTAKALKILLEKARFSVDLVYDGTEAWEFIRSMSYDVVVLDIMMPEKSGLEVLELMRKNSISTPVLLLTAKAEVEDRVLGLESGADDYLPKPFNTSELIARVRALGRRSEHYSSPLLTIGNLELDSNRFELKVKDQSITLTNKEFQLLELFIRHPGFVFSSEHLIEKIWGFDTDSNVEVVWTYIAYIRKKLRSLSANVEIVTIRGAGYSLEVSTC